MDESDLSISSISSKKLENIAQKAQVAVFRKELDSQSQIAEQLIESALPPGKGEKLNTVA